MKEWQNLPRAGIHTPASQQITWMNCQWYWNTFFTEYCYCYCSTFHWIANNHGSSCPDNMVTSAHWRLRSVPEFGVPLQISTGFASWQRYCTPSSSGRQPNFVALNRRRHLCSAGRPSRWALAHISSSQSIATAIAILSVVLLTTTARGMCVYMCVCLPVSVCSGGGYRSPLKPTRSLLGFVNFASVDATAVCVPVM